MWESAVNGDRQYSIPTSSNISDQIARQRATEDLHAWSIYRQNLNSDFTDSALGSTERSPLPYGNFQLKESTVQTILNHPKYGPAKNHSELGANMYTYLRFGLPRVFPPNKPGRDGSSGYDSSDDGIRLSRERNAQMNARRSRSIPNLYCKSNDHDYAADKTLNEEKKNIDCSDKLKMEQHTDNLRASSEADLIAAPNEIYHQTQQRFTEWQAKQSKSTVARDSNLSYDQHRVTPLGHAMQNTDVEGRSDFGGSKLGSHISGVSHKQPLNGNLSIHVSREKLLLNEKIRSESVFSSIAPEQNGAATISKHPHLQVRKLGFEIDRSPIWKRLCGLARVKQRLLEDLSFEARGGEILGILATKGKCKLFLLKSNFCLVMRVKYCIFQ